MLPMKLLTPFQAENEYHIRDTYNYATVQVHVPAEDSCTCHISAVHQSSNVSPNMYPRLMQADIQMPKRHFRLLEDTHFNSAMEAAIQQAVRHIEAQDMDCRYDVGLSD
jgi:protein arginine N-methyltransferase 7